MVKISTMGLAALGVSAAVITAPGALADPADAAAPAEPGTSVQAAPANTAATDVVCGTAHGVPHLTSPQNLPPGTTDNPDQQSKGLGYLRDLLHASGPRTSSRATRCCCSRSVR